MPAQAPGPGPLDLDDVLVPLPDSGRVFSGRRRVRLGDVSPGGRLRLDALACFAQDVSNDDTVDAGLRDDMAWVARRTVIEVHTEARLREELELVTFCGGVGSRWAERRVSVRGEHGAHFELATLWVHVDLDTGRPLRLPEQFHQLFGEAAGGRTVRARLRHGDPPRTVGGEDSVPWVLRFSDFDVLGHVNNAVTWEVVEEERALRGDLRAPLRAEVEYREAIERGSEVGRLSLDQEGGGFTMWMVDAAAPQRVFGSARLSPLT